MRTTTFDSSPLTVSVLATVFGFIRLIRPQQWYKNGIVFVPLVFSGSVFQLHLWPRAFLAFAAFCLIASAAYSVNDVLDRKRDQNHPTKKNRPVANGTIGVTPALLFALVLVVSGLALLTLLDRGTLAIGGLWIAVQTGYNLFLKQAFLWDVLTIAVGFVLRALAGTTAIAIGPPTEWLIVCTFLFAFYLGLAKRRHERALVENGNSNGDHRKVLADYSIPFLDRSMQTATGLVIITYTLYATLGTTPWMLMTLPFAIYGILRHNHLTTRTDRSDESEVIFKDLPTLINAAGWVLVVIAVLAGAPQMLVAWVGGSG